MIFKTINFMFSLLIIVGTYLIFMPFLKYLGEKMIELGAPLATQQWFFLMERWSWILFLIAAIFVFLLWIFRREPTAVEY